MEFIISKIFWVFFMPSNLLVLLLLLGAFWSLSHNALRQRLGRNLCFLIALAMFLIAIFPFGDWAMIPLKNLFPPSIPDHVDGIVVLGGDERPLASEQRSQPVIKDSAQRYI